MWLRAVLGVGGGGGVLNNNSSLQDTLVTAIVTLTDRLFNQGNHPGVH